MRKLISYVCFIGMFCICLTCAGCSKKAAQLSSYVRSDSDSLSVTLVDGTATADGLTIEIANNTDEEVTYGMEFSVEQQRDGEWYEMDIDQYFQALDVILDANGTNTFDVLLDEPLDNGHYRIIKSFTTSSGTLRYDVEFDVE